MRKIKKITAILLITLCLAMSLTACGKAEETIILNLVEGNISEIYLGEFDDTYLKIVDATEAEAQQAYLENIELQVLFEQMLDFTGFSGTRFLNLPLAYHSFFRYIKFAIRSISSVSVLSRTWQYRSIVICKELCPNIFCNVLGSIPFSIQFVAKV